MNFLNKTLIYGLIPLAGLILSSCAEGRVDYMKPEPRESPVANSKIINRPREVVWNSSIPEISKHFFVINNLDKSSGFLNVSYSGDPEKYIDCGHITSYVKTGFKERTYNFASAKSQQAFEIMDPTLGLVFIDRKMSLDGRVNLIFEELSETSTKVSANTRYIVQLQATAKNIANISSSFTNTISFTTGGNALFDNNSIYCIATGALEEELLSLIH